MQTGMRYFISVQICSNGKENEKELPVYILAVFVLIDFTTVKFVSLGWYPLKGS
jgi:hypothetical protein